MDPANQGEMLQMQLADAQAEIKAQKQRADAEKLRADRFEAQLRSTRYQAWIQDRRSLSKDCRGCRTVSQKQACYL